MKLKIGVREVENDVENLSNNMKSKKSKKNKTRDVDLIEDMMSRKVIDADQAKREAEGRMDRMRRKIDSVQGKNSRKTRHLMKLLRKENAILKTNIQKKHEEKIEHLKNIYQVGKQNKKEDIPKELKRYEEIEIYKKGKIEVNDVQSKVEIAVHGEVVLDNDEIEVLK